MAKIQDAASLNSGLLACWRLWRQKLQQSDLRVSFSLDVVVVAFMNTEGPLVPLVIFAHSKFTFFRLLISNRGLLSRMFIPKVQMGDNLSTVFTQIYPNSFKLYYFYYFEPKFDGFSCILIPLWRIWCMTYK
jgi:hypothetical protein